MWRSVLGGLSVAAVLLGSPPVARAVSIWNEVLDGELSEDHLAPTALGELAVGSNTATLRSVFYAGDRNTELDYFSIVVPAGHRLDALVLTAWPEPYKFSRILLAVEDGEVFTDLPGFPISHALGFISLGPEVVGTDVLDDMGAACCITEGFTPPLREGTYTFYANLPIFVLLRPLQFTIDFRLSKIPEPGTALLVALGLAGLARRAGARSRSGRARLGTRSPA